MLKKLAVLAAFFFAATIPLTPPAAAWEEACVKFPLWKTWFVGGFHVVHGDPRLRDYFPELLPLHGGHGGRPKPTPGRLLDLVPRSREVKPWVGGFRHSGLFLANQSRCVNIAHIRPGEGFQVYVQTTEFGRAWCPPHPVHAPKVGYQQQHGRYKKIWWEAWGVTGDPQCKYWRESN